MKTIFRPLRTFRENLRQINAAVNASREFSEASRTRGDASGSVSPLSGIPL
jgi:hypothetical protein